MDGHNLAVPLLIPIDDGPNGNQMARDVLRVNEVHAPDDLVFYPKLVLLYQGGYTHLKLLHEQIPVEYANLPEHERKMMSR